MQRVFKIGDTKIMGDPHLGRSFINGVPLSRRGDREKMVRAAFIDALNPRGALFHVCVGDLFDKPNVSLETIWFAATEYNTAAQSHPDTQFIVLAGNHDLDRDQTKVSALQIFAGLLWSENVDVIMDPTNHEVGLLIPWSPLHNAEELIRESDLEGRNRIRSLGPGRRRAEPDPDRCFEGAWRQPCIQWSCPSSTY